MRKERGRLGLLLREGANVYASRRRAAFDPFDYGEVRKLRFSAFPVEARQTPIKFAWQRKLNQTNLPKGKDVKVTFCFG